MFKTERRNEEVKVVDASMESDNECNDDKDYACSEEDGDDVEIGTSTNKVTQSPQKNGYAKKENNIEAEKKPAKKSRKSRS